MAIFASGYDSSQFLKEEAISELMIGHDVLMEHCYVIGEDPSRLTMINGDPRVFNSLVYEWLNECT